jgi:hypothetical protein
MAKCRYCGAETQLYEMGIPICPECADSPERRRKFLETQAVGTSDPPSQNQEE